MKIMDWVEILNQNNPNPNPNVYQQIQYAHPLIFNFEYDFWDGHYKVKFQRKFVEHYFSRELGLDTPAMFQFQLKSTLDLIMPYYTKLFESEMLSFKPFEDMNIVEVLHRENDKNKNGTETNDDTSTGSQTAHNTQSGTVSDKDTGTDTTTNTGTQKDAGSKTSTDTVNKLHVNEFSDTPQAMLQNKPGSIYLTTRTTDTDDDTDAYTDTTNNTRTDDLTQKLQYGKTHLQTVDLNNDGTNSYNSSNNRNKTISGVEKAIEEYTRTRSGATGKYTYMQLLEQYRNTFLNVTRMLIEAPEIKSLFMFIL